jgi:hypothetical protein
MGWALFTPTGSNGEILVSTDWITGIAPAFRRKWDQRFESAFLQHAVCLSSEPRGCMRKAPHFGGILRVAGDVRRDVPAANRAFFALSL